MTGPFTLLSFAFRNIRRRPLRSLILIISIGLPVSALVFALSFNRRVESAIRLTVDSLGADILIVPSGSSGAAEDILIENKAKTFYMDRLVLERIRQIKGIDQVAGQTYLKSSAGECCDVPETVVIAFNQDTDFIIRPVLARSLGRRLVRGEAVAGSESAMNVSADLTEIEVVLFGNIFRMAGVLEKTVTGLDNAIFIDESNIEDILNKGKTGLKQGQISILFAKVKRGTDPAVVAGDIEDSVIEADAVPGKDIGRNILQTLRELNRVFFSAVALSSVLAVFLVWAVFSAVVNERAWEVGIMRAVGASGGYVSRLFFAEVLFIGLTGSAIGVIAGTALSMAVIKQFYLLKGVAADLALHERIVVGMLSFVSGTAICLAGALAPVRRLKNLEPVCAVRRE